MSKVVHAPGKKKYAVSLVDFGIVNASGGSGEVRLALVVVKARNDKARLENI